MHLVGSTQIQGRSTVGGNICNGSPAADTTCPLIVNRGRAVIVGPEGERIVNVEELFKGPGKTVLGRGDVLVAFLIPRPAPRTADAYLRLIPRTEMDIAVAGAAVSVTLDAGGVCTAARVAIAAVAPTPLLVADAGAGADRIAPRGRSAGARRRPPRAPPPDRSTTNAGTADYRRTVVGVLTRRAASIAGARASALK